jgi:N-acetylglucosamine kinase-like BadF-type ATPase
MASHTSSIVLGIDGGGTRTRAALVDGMGHLCGFGSAGPSNYQAVGIETAGGNIAEAVAGAWRQAGGDARAADAAFLGMAGVVAEHDRRAIGSIADAQQLAHSVTIDHDIRTALAGGLAGKPGIALIAGTGSSCYGRRADGLAWRSGGWGHLIDDPGSGYWLGVQGLAAITRAFDGRGEATSLAAPMMERLGIRAMDEVLHLAGAEGLRKDEIAALAPLVLRIASYGDRVARNIVARGSDELARMVEAVMLRLAWDGGAPVIMTGGVASDHYYCEAIRKALDRRAPAAELAETILPPILGAALLALEQIGVRGDERVIDELQRSAASLRD